MSDLSSDSGEMEFDKAHAPDGEALALSSAQLGIWFAQKLDPSSPAYNIGEYVEIDGPVVLPLFERALRQVVAEADTLRLRFSEEAGEPRQMVGANAAWSPSAKPPAPWASCWPGPARWKKTPPSAASKRPDASSAPP